MYGVIANSRAARRQRDFCPLDEWLRERYGLGFLELQTFGFAFFARSNIGDRDNGQMHFTNADYFGTTGLASAYEQALPAIAAPREWFVEEFTRSREHPRRAAYEIQPFLRRPALLQRDGNAVVLGLRALEGWLGATGAYYRLFDIARGRSSEDMERFRRFNGWLQERYVRHLTHVTHPHPRRRVLAGSGRVIPEQTYRVKRRGEFLTTDVAIDLGVDLLLIEVTSKRVTQRSLVDGDITAVVADVRALVLEKMKQLGRVTADLVEGRAELPGVDIAYVQRVWPLIVSPDGVFLSPSLWAWCREQGGHHLADPPGRKQRMQPLVLLDSEEFEALAGLVRGGEALIGILESKTSDLWRERDFKAWLLDGPATYKKTELPLIQQDVDRNFRAMLRVLRVTGSPDPRTGVTLDLAA